MDATINAKTIIDYVNKEREFEYIGLLSRFYHLDYDRLCDFALDLYNYQLRNHLDSRGAKIMTLSNTCDYAYTLCCEEKRNAQND
jgi:hypothetical protein